jgi:uncharacterized protein (TIGR02145 family)
LASAQNKVVVIPLGSSGVKAVNDTSPCDAAKAGTIRWTGTSLEVCDGTEWTVISLESVGTVISAGQVWMDRNLGASRIAISFSDSAAYGDLYQWGRLTDGHEQRTSPTTTMTISTTDVPGHGSFITPSCYPYDWRSPENANLWQGVSGTNNPCPAGFRLPTDVEFDTERLSWSSQDYNGAFVSPLKRVSAGSHDYYDGKLYYEGSYGYYWSSTVDGSYSRYLLFTSGNANMYSYSRAYGFSVRCLKD